MTEYDGAMTRALRRAVDRLGERELSILLYGLIAQVPDDVEWQLRDMGRRLGIPVDLSGEPRPR